MAVYCHIVHACDEPCNVASCYNNSKLLTSDSQVFALAAVLHLCVISSYLLCVLENHAKLKLYEISVLLFHVYFYYWDCLDAECLLGPAYWLQQH